MKNSGFTLIELLIVIAIIAVLAAILFPVFAAAKERARATTETTQAKEIGMSVKLYLNDYDDTMPIFYAYNSVPPTSGPHWEDWPPYGSTDKPLKARLPRTLAPSSAAPLSVPPASAVTE